jgi:hypothetical protein
MLVGDSDGYIDWRSVGNCFQWACDPSLPPARYFVVYSVDADGERSPGAHAGFFDLEWMESGNPIGATPVYLSGVDVDGVGFDVPLQQTDTNTAVGVLTGRLTWLVPDEFDSGHVTQYAVYLLASADAEPAGADPFQLVPTGTNQLDFENLAQGSPQWWRVYWRNTQFIDGAPTTVESTDFAGPLQLVDVGTLVETTTAISTTTTLPGLPAVTNVAFTDDDMRRGWIGGLHGVTWTLPDDTSSIDHFEVYITNTPTSLEDYPEGSEQY